MAQSNIQRELRRGSLELAILHLLLQKDHYGYELTVSLAHHSGNLLTIKEGTLYPVLYRLEENGWVVIYWETVDRGNPRKYYRITEAGKAAYHALRLEWDEFFAKMQLLLRGEEGNARE